MKTSTPLLGLLGLAMAVTMGGCASTPVMGSLVYYDSGDIWCWTNGPGWRYFGNQRVRITRDHVIEPTRPPGEPHRPPPEPGKIPPGGRICYIFIANDGTVLRSDDALAFWPIGRLDDNEEFLAGGGSGGPAAGFRGSFNPSGGSFRLASSPSAAFRNLTAAVLGNAAAGLSGASGSYRNGAASYRGGSYSSGSYHGDGGYRSGSGGGGRSFSGGGGGHSGGGGGSGGGSRSSGGGGSNGNRQH